MKKDFRLGLEKLDQKVLLSSNPWYIDAVKADQLWNISSVVGSKPVVAIVDSGVDLNHSSLKQDIWVNPGEKLDGIDNDNNGYVDDINGWNFSNNTNNVQDGYYHGTHVAGIVDSIGHGNLSIMPIKFMDNNGSGSAGAAATAIDYVTYMKTKGVNVVAINCSFGGIQSYSIPLANAIKNASDNGIVVVMAAGNNGDNIDVTPRYPGSFNYTNTITVAAINPDLSLAGYSCYGANSVTVAAPGTDILSTLPNNNYGSVSGTSMATAVVSGSVGLLNEFGHYSATTIKNAIIYGCDMITGLANKVHYGLIDLAKSIGWLKAQTQITQVKPPASIPPSNPVLSAPIVSLVYKITNVSNAAVAGWSKVNNSNSKPVVQIYINNILRYSVVSNLYRTDTKSNNGFNVSINRKFLNLKSNLLEIRVIDSMNHLSSIAYKGYIWR